VRFVSRFVSRIRACVGVRARIGARVGVGWVRRAPVLLGAGACPGFYVYTAYSNRCTIYRLQQQVCDLPPTHTAYTNTLTPYRLLLTAHVGMMRLPLTFTSCLNTLGFIFYLVFLALWCFLIGVVLPIGFSVIISFGAVGKSDYFLVFFPPLPFLALLTLCASFTSFPEVVWDLSIPLPFGASLLALFKAARYFLRSGVEWYFLL